MSMTKTMNDLKAELIKAMGPQMARDPALVAQLLDEARDMLLANKGIRYAAQAVVDCYIETGELD